MFDAPNRPPSVCHYPDCTLRANSDAFACPDHFRMLPVAVARRAAAAWNFGTVRDFDEYRGALSLALDAWALVK
jgi:hypothetical protein